LSKSTCLWGIFGGIYEKKVFTALVLCLTRGVFAQQLEKLTYEELKTDGTIGRTVTVEVYFLGWRQIAHSMEDKR